MTRTNSDSEISRYSSFIHCSRLILLLSFLIPLSAVFAADIPAASQQQEAEQSVFINDFSRSIEDSIKAETANQERYKEQLKQARTNTTYFSAAINGYQLQLSAYGNLLLATGADITSIQKTRTELRTLLAEIQKMHDEIAPKREGILTEKATLEQQKSLIHKQLTEIENIKDKDAVIRLLQKNAKDLSGILVEKGKSIEKLEKLFTDRLSTIKTLLASYTELSEKFDTLLEVRKKEHLFERRQSLLTVEVLPLLENEIQSLVSQTAALAKPDTWKKALDDLWESAGIVLISLTIVFCAVLFLLKRIHNILHGLESHPFVETLGKWHLMTFRLMNRSIIPGGIALLCHLYAGIEILYPAAQVFQLATHLLFVMIITRWARLVLDLWPMERRSPFTDTGRLHRLILVIRYFSWTHLIMGAAIGASAALLLVLRLIFSVWILTRAFSIWKQFSASGIPKAGDAGDRPWTLINLTAKYLCLSLGGAALLLDMIGYGPLSIHWLLSWGRSSAVAIWWFLFFHLFQEWDRYYREKSTSQRDELLHDEYPLQWLTIRFGQFIWFVSLVMLLVLAWGGRQSVLARTLELLGRPLQIGNMTFSFLGVFYAVVVLLITHAVTRLWRWIFQTKFLSRSGMELGLQASITTITLYAIWCFGILIALHTFGLNTASLAVAFGALGIGLGFGLQNIFNNFISGIILLFERPIQVGDDVEINGTWANVKKINVRSTVVQTYDNASLIIPNSEFISSQVTNWSFKDKRLRRSINVGVAYGSDIALVRDTLLEIAGKTPKVLKYPKPDVLFLDFGDSALIFRLRIWTDIDHMLLVETSIRFEIDRLFREKGIEISFPQRDIHIRSVVPPSLPQVLDAAKPETRDDGNEQDSHAAAEEAPTKRSTPNIRTT